MRSLLTMMTYLAAAVILTSCSGTKPPTRSEGKATIIIDANSFLGDGKSGGGAMLVWMLYGAKRADWHKGNDYKYSFEEEYDARNELADAWRELKKDEPDTEDRYLDTLVRVDDAGFLREYVWHYFKTREWTQPSNLQMERFETWRKATIPNHVPETKATVSE